MITVLVHEGKARVRGQLAYDNPDVAMIEVFYTIGKWMQRVYNVRRKFKREHIISGGNLSGVYHFYTMAVTAANMV